MQNVAYFLSTYFNTTVEKIPESECMTNDYVLPLDYNVTTRNRGFSQTREVSKLDVLAMFTSKITVHYKNEPLCNGIMIFLNQLTPLKEI